MNTNKKIWRGVSVLEQWIRAFWLVALVLGAGLTVFLPEVVQSIESTPHPALVYAIFGVAGSAVLLCAHALWCYVREESLLLQLQQTPPAQRLDTLNALSWRSDLAPACVALLDHPGEAQVQQAVVENELYVCEERLLSRLTLPAYLSGALVGLGLVGTFIGLLGALADLGGLFSSLTDMGGNDADPVAMFTSMLNKLQEPMRGMGTAFVASLYGLLGSLVLGLVIYSVKKSGMQAIGQVHTLIRQVKADEARHLRSAPTVTRSGETQQEIERHVAMLAGWGEAAHGGLAELKALREVLTPALERMIAEQARTNEHVLRMSEQLLQSRAEMHELANRRAPNLGRLASVVLVSVAVATVSAAGATWMLVSRAWPVAPVVAVPAPQPAAAALAASSEAVNVIRPSVDASVQELVVVSGQSLSRIARAAGVSLEALLSANPGLSMHSTLLVGQTVRVPAAQPKASGSD